MDINTNSFTNIGQIFNRNLGLDDRNNNGRIEKGMDEGYEEFEEKYGDADTGFTNYFGRELEAGNNKLCEKEIIDYYYLNIRYNFTEETQQIEQEVNQHIIDNDLPLIWIDEDNDGNGIGDVEEACSISDIDEESANSTITNAFRQIGLSHSSRGETNYTLLESINAEHYLCTEAANFTYFNLTNNNIPSIFIGAVQTDASSISNAISHIYNYLPNTDSYIDLTGSTVNGNFTRNRRFYTYLINPIQTLANYYFKEYLVTREISSLEKSVAIDPFAHERVINLAINYYHSGEKEKAAILGASVAWQFEEGSPINPIYEAEFERNAETFVKLAEFYSR